MQGNAGAQFNLGLMYYFGQSVTPDYVQVLMWFNLAGAQGNKPAAQAQGVVARRMTPAQLAEARRRAARWPVYFRNA